MAHRLYELAHDPKVLLSDVTMTRQDKSKEHTSAFDHKSHRSLELLELALTVGTTESPEFPNDDDLAVLRQQAPEILKLDAGQRLELLDQILVSPRVDCALSLLEETGILGVLLPEVVALKGFHESSPIHHKDLWTHTLIVTRNTEPDADLRWTALFHDVGKIPSRQVSPKGKLTFWRHEAVSSWLFRGAAARLALPLQRRERIAFVIEHHARVNAYEPTWSDRAVRRLIRDAGPYLADIIAFASADYTTERPRTVKRIRNRLKHLRERLEGLEKDSELRLPTGLGAEIQRSLKLEPGPKLGEAMTWLRARLLAGELAPSEDFTVYLEALKKRKPPYEEAQKG